MNKVQVVSFAFEKKRKKKIERDRKRCLQRTAVRFPCFRSLGEPGSIQGHIGWIHSYKKVNLHTRTAQSTFRAFSIVTSLFSGQKMTYTTRRSVQPWRWRPWRGPHGPSAPKSNKHQSRTLQLDQTSTRVHVKAKKAPSKEYTWWPVEDLGYKLNNLRNIYRLALGNFILNCTTTAFYTGAGLIGVGTYPCQLLPREGTLVAGIEKCGSDFQKILCRSAK